ncbi:hypothetical protein [Tissierella praeacuta]|uniref:hypothetical protein n=1 Tax=Tissierella praeacuta TaxID=43131 RepID=UPI002FDA7F91
MIIHDETSVPDFLKMLDDLTSTHLEIGVFGEDDSEILMIANVNEFGCQIEVTEKMRNYLRAIGLPLKNDTKYINIPERSFIRGGYQENKNKIIDNAEVLLEKVINLQFPVETFFETLGEYIVGLIQQYLTDLRTPKNHPFTIAKKGSSNPLIDTGRLRQSITYKVVKN